MCLNPKYAFKSQYVTSEGEVKTKLFFIEKHVYEKYKDNKEIYVSIPCGHCFDCKNKIVREWTYRAMSEFMYWDKGIFLTLTYADTDGELCRRDLQLFLKRFRKKISPLKIRYFGCGEYGSRGKRPHFHLIIYNYVPNDLQYFFTKDNIDYFLSQEIEKLWDKGYILISDVTYTSCHYSTNYMQKLNDFEEKKVKPFRVMSTRPGIGLNYFLENYHDFVMTDKLYVDGKNISLPRYFLNKIKSIDMIEYLKVREFRAIKSDLLERSGYINQRINYVKSKFNVDLKDLF